MKRVAWIEVTNSCVWNCQYCYAKSEEKGKYSFPQDKVSLLIDNLIRHNYNAVVLTGGEPLCYDHIEGFLEQFLEAGLIVYVLTSGYNIERISSSLRHPNLRLQISLDSINPDINALLRGENACEYAIKAMDYVLSNGYPPKQLRIATTLTKINYSYLEALFIYLTRRHIETWHISYFTHNGRSLEDFSLPINIRIPVERQLLDYAIQSLGKMEINGILAGTIIFNIANQVVNCSELGIEIFIDTFGYVYPCLPFASKEFRIGNLFETEDLSAILKDFVKTRFREVCILRWMKLPRCKECDLHSICGGGCAANAYWKNGTIFSIEEDYCEAFKTVAKDIQKLDRETFAALSAVYAKHLG